MAADIFMKNQGATYSATPAVRGLTLPVRLNFDRTNRNTMTYAIVHKGFEPFKRHISFNVVTT